MTAAVAPPPDRERRRMRGDDRRRQLLDAAASLVSARGASALTMERLAAEAGVSKALPYKHFDNAEAVLVELYRRETRALGAAVWRALSDRPEGADATRVAVHAYFDELVRRGPVLAPLSRPGSTIGAVADPGQAGVIFEADLLTRSGLDRRRAKAIAGMIQGAVVGAASTLLAGLGDRHELEDDLVLLINGLVRRAR